MPVPRGLRSLLRLMENQMLGQVPQQELLVMLLEEQVIVVQFWMGWLVDVTPAGCT